MEQKSQNSRHCFTLDMVVKKRQVKKCLVSDETNREAEEHGSHLEMFYDMTIEIYLTFYSAPFSIPRHFAFFHAVNLNYALYFGDIC